MSDDTVRIRRLASKALESGHVSGANPILKDLITLCDAVEHQERLIAHDKDRPPMSWFLRWMEKARIEGGTWNADETEFTNATFGDVEVERLFTMWLDSYSEDAAVATILRERMA